MAKYRKIDPRIWNDAKFRGLSDNGKLVFLFLLTHPHMTALGAMRSTLSGMAEELGWKPKAFQEAFGEAFAKGMVKHDSEACFVWLPRFLRYNKPESPNVVKAWVSSLDLLPECGMKFLLIQEVKDYLKGLPEAFGEALPEAFAKAMPYQEQEQEQEPEQEQERERAAPARMNAKGQKMCPDDWEPSDKLLSKIEEEGVRKRLIEGGTSVELELERMKSCTFSTPRSDWNKTAWSWLLTECKKINEREARYGNRR